MAKWKNTKYTGVRYREHPVRKHGATPDKYFSIRYQHEGKRIEEGLGWASAGETASKAAVMHAELKTAARKGKGAARLSEQRTRKAAKMAAAQKAKTEESMRNVSYAKYISDYYDAGDVKASTLVRETSLNKLWIVPVIGDARVSDLSAFHIKKISHKMKRAGKSPRSIQYAIGVVRKILNHAIRSGYYHAVNPVSALEKRDRPKISNKRDRFFSHTEAETLLTALLIRSKDVHDMALLSIHAGLRAGEIFALDWQHLDMDNRQIKLVNTKNGHNRVVSMTVAVADMFKSRAREAGVQLVFPNSHGLIMKRMSKTFERVIEELGLNAGVTDRLSKAVFHTCRHTCASWLVQSGVPLYQVKEIMGHSTIAITERYAHLCPAGQVAAFAAMESAFNESKLQRSQVVNLH